MFAKLSSAKLSAPRASIELKDLSAQPVSLRIASIENGPPFYVLIATLVLRARDVNSITDHDALPAGSSMCFSRKKYASSFVGSLS